MVAVHGIGCGCLVPGDNGDGRESWVKLIRGCYVVACDAILDGGDRMWAKNVSV
jgi:hypothetical protein